MVSNSAILDVFVADLRKQLGQRLKEIRLFGARARGDHSEDSDYDFLVIVDEVTAEVEERIEALCADLLWDYGAVVSASAISAEGLEHLRFEPFIMNIQKEGIRLG